MRKFRLQALSLGVVLGATILGFAEKARADVDPTEAKTIARNYVRERDEWMGHQSTQFIGRVSGPAGEPAYYFVHASVQEDRECILNVVIEATTGKVRPFAFLGPNRIKVKTHTKTDCSSVGLKDAAAIADNYARRFDPPFKGEVSRIHLLHYTGEVLPEGVWSFVYSGSRWQGDVCTFRVLVAYHTGAIIPSVWQRSDGKIASTSREWSCEDQGSDWPQ